MGQFDDGRFGDKSVIRHDPFDGNAFHALFQKILGLVLGLIFVVCFRLNKHPLQPNIWSTVEFAYSDFGYNDTSPIKRRVFFGPGRISIFYVH